jgi:hypothetical protein
MSNQPPTNPNPNFALKPEELAQLRQYLEARFSQEELRTLAYDLGIDYQDLPHTNKATLARELLAHVTRTQQLAALLQLALAKRPDSIIAAIYQGSPNNSATGDSNSASPTAAESGSVSTGAATPNHTYNISGDYFNVAGVEQLIQKPSGPIHINNSKTTVHNENKGDVTMGDNIKVSDNQNSNINIKNVKSKIENSLQHVSAMPHGNDASKAKSETLIKQLEAELEKVSDSHPDDVATILERLEALTKEASKPKLDKEEVETRGTSLVKAAKRIESVLPTVFSIATQLAAHLSGAF